MSKQVMQDGREDVTLPGERLNPARNEQLRKLTSSDLWQFLRFCIVGSLNTIIDFGILNLLLWLYPTTSVWKTLGYNSLAVLLASTNSFFWNKYWTFRQRNPVTSQEVYRFIVVAGGTTIMNDSLMWLLGRTFPGIIGSNLLGANVLKLIAITGTMSISFFGMRLWVFFQRRFAEEERSLADYETEKLPALKLFYDPDTSVTYALGKSRSGNKAAQNHTYASRMQKHWQVEEPISFSLVETPPSSSYTPVLPVTPLSALNSGQSLARNLRSVKLRPLRETESALES